MLCCGVKKSDSKTTNLGVIMIKTNNYRRKKSNEGTMTKEELKKILKLYHKIARQIHEKKSEAIGEHYGRKYVIHIPEWAWLLEDFIKTVIDSEENLFFSKVMTECYIKGEKDKFILTRNPISESTFYRWKRKFKEKIYELYIANGIVNKNEIIKNKILDWE